jgi:hypothetical protein
METFAARSEVYPRRCVGNGAMTKPLCLIAVPFGRKEAGGRSIEFDAVWHQVIEPAVAAAQMKPLRAEEVDGTIDTPMFERLVLCEFAVCDLTPADSTVFYKLGVRHAARPATTVLIAPDDVPLPLDLAMPHVLHYRLGPDGRPTQGTDDARKLSRLLEDCRANRHHSSPLLHLLDGFKTPEVPSDKTDVFRREADYAATRKAELAAARQQGREAVAAVRHSLGSLDAVESGVVIDLLLSHRAVKDWQGMVDLVSDMPETLRTTVLVQEQLGLALNRIGRSDAAEQVLTDLIASRGSSSETFGILGRVYKDRWERADKAGNTDEARALLGKAIDAYRRGFEADWRDHYPGINAVTLMELRDPPDPERLKLIPVVRYAVERRIAGKTSDYWDWATLLELAVLANDETGATSALAEAQAAMRETWEPETTAGNLRLIREARDRRGGSAPWAKAIETALRRGRS